MTMPEDTIFPDGLRVLAVDGSAVCLKLLVTLLEKCRYKVTSTVNPFEALEKIRENKRNYDIVITDVKINEIDGFKILDIIVYETDLPVIITSSDDSKYTVMKGISHGALDYLLKPVRLEVIKNIWQHVVRKSIVKSNETNETICQSLDHSNGQENAELYPIKKRQKRIAWTAELNHKFLDAVKELGSNAVPTKILQHMNVPDLTRANVASHLQKHRNLLNNSNAKTDKRLVSRKKVANGDQFCKKESSIDQHVVHMNKLRQELYQLRQQNQNIFVQQFSSGPPPPPPQLVNHVIPQTMQICTPENGLNHNQNQMAGAENNYQNLQQNYVSMFNEDYKIEGDHSHNHDHGHGHEEVNLLGSTDYYSFDMYDSFQLDSEEIASIGGFPLNTQSSLLDDLTSFVGQIDNEEQLF